MIQIDMEMPDKCKSCRFFVDCEQCEGKTSRCTAKDDYFDTEYGDSIIPKERPDDCPLISVKEIPESERDGFIKKFLEACANEIQRRMTMYDG